MLRVGVLVPWGERFEEEIKKVRSIGFVSGQVSIWDMSLYADTQANAKRIKDICDRNSFEITSLWCGWSGPVDWTYPGMYATLGLVPAWLRNQRMRDLMDGAAFGRAMGIKDIVTHIGYIPDDPFCEDYLGITAALKVIGTELRRHGQRLLFETGEELPVTLVQMMKATGLDNLGVNVDPANLISSGRANNAAEALKYFGKLTMGMHAKDAVRPKDHDAKGYEVPIGQGHADFPALVRILKEIGYSGDITIEREGVSSDVWEKDITAAKSFLEGVIG